MTDAVARKTGFVAQGRETLILQWPLGPTYVFASVAFGLATMVQLVKLFRDAVSEAPSGTDRSSWTGVSMVTLLGALVLGVALWALWDLDSLQSIAGAQPGLVVVIAFAILWLAVLCQIPLAAAAALIGIAGTALALGMKSTGRVFANDAM